MWFGKFFINLALIWSFMHSSWAAPGSLLRSNPDYVIVPVVNELAETQDDIDPSERRVVEEAANDPKIISGKTKAKISLGFSRWVPFSQLNDDYALWPTLGVEALLGGLAIFTGVGFVVVLASAGALAIGTIAFFGLVSGGFESTEKNLSIPVSFNARYWGEGKITGIVTLKGRKKCAAISLPFVGTENSQGTYDLKFQDTLIDFGIFGDYGKTKSLNLKQDIILYSNGRKGTKCSWKLEKNMALNF